MNYITLPNYGILQTTIPGEDLYPVYEEIKTIQSSFEDHINDKYNHSLVGNIDHEYRLVKSVPHLFKLILPSITEYEEKTEYLSRISYEYLGSKARNIKMRDTWVNFQRKHEFNPSHFHSGLLSFILWIQIPYDAEKELKEGIGKDSNRPMSGATEFLYIKSDGRIGSMIFKPQENHLLMFPSYMQHLVYPFSTSDDFRISISGNLGFDI